MSIAWAGGVTMAPTNEVVCEREGCNETFVKRTHNQKYHDNECTRLATNVKIMEKYYERQDQRLGKLRICKVCNITKLSRYNSMSVCAGCKSKQQEEINNSVWNMLSQANLV